MRPQPGFPLCRRRPLLFGRQGLRRLLLLQLRQDCRQFPFEPGMQDRIGDRDNAFGADLAGGRAKEREQFGRATPLVLVRLQRGVALGLPRGPGLRDSLVGSRFILVELENACRFRLLIRQLNQSFFSGVWASYVVTVPLLRTRSA